MSDHIDMQDTLHPFYSQLEDSYPIIIKADKTDPNVVYIEASNEALDSQKDIIVMKALEEQAETFLSKGVISWDHLHKIKNDPGYIVGEPLDVQFLKDEKRTWVKAKLYESVDYARKILSLLKSGSTRLGASVGGFIKKRKSLSKAVSLILSVIWDELAITYKPVNDGTMGNVSLIPMGAFAKALTAGAGVDAAEFAGGRALVSESLQGNIVSLDVSSIISELIIHIHSGDVQTADDLKNFLQERDAINLYAKLANLLIKRFQKSEVNYAKKKNFTFTTY